MTTEFDPNNQVNLDAVSASLQVRAWSFYRFSGEAVLTRRRSLACHCLVQFDALNSVSVAFLDAVVNALLTSQSNGASLQTLFSSRMQPAFSEFTAFMKKYVGSMIILAGEGERTAACVRLARRRLHG